MSFSFTNLSSSHSVKGSWAVENSILNTERGFSSEHTKLEIPLSASSNSFWGGRNLWLNLRYETAENQALSSGFSSLFQDQFMVTWKGILEFWRRFIFINSPNTITYLNLFIRFFSWEILIFHWDPTFRKRIFSCLPCVFQGQILNSWRNVLQNQERFLF